MKAYDSIDYFGKYWNIPIFAFDKIDGSNLRFEYSHKRGFYKSGTRHMMIDETHDTFGFAVSMFKEKYSEGMSRIFKSKDYRNIQSFVCYAELIGEKSEFGQHDFVNDKFDMVLFDISLYKKGFLEPKTFIKDFGSLGIPEVIYEGNLNKEFVEEVKENKYNLKEGVICKGKVKKDMLYYCKIKTNDWHQRLKDYKLKTGKYELFADEEEQILKFEK